MTFGPTLIPIQEISFFDRDLVWFSRCHRVRFEVWFWNPAISSIWVFKPFTRQSSLVCTNKSVLLHTANCGAQLGRVERNLDGIFWQFMCLFQLCFSCCWMVSRSDWGIQIIVSFSRVSFHWLNPKSHTVSIQSKGQTGKMPYIYIRSLNLYVHQYVTWCIVIRDLLTDVFECLQRTVRNSWHADLRCICFFIQLADSQPFEIAEFLHSIPKSIC